jgi:hypothetical protein
MIGSENATSNRNSVSIILLSCLSFWISYGNAEALASPIDAAVGSESVGARSQSVPAATASSDEFSPTPSRSCIAMYLIWSVRLLASRTVDTALPASKFVSELLTGKVFDGLSLGPRRGDASALAVGFSIAGGKGLDLLTSNPRSIRQTTVRCHTRWRALDSITAPVSSDRGVFTKK